MAEIVPGSAAFIGAGDVYLALYADGVLQGEKKIGNVPEFVINAPDIEEKELIGRTRATFGQTIKTITTKVTQELQMTINDVMVKETFATAMYGDMSDITQTGGTDATAVDVKVFTDQWTKLGHMNLDPDVPPVVTDATGVTTYTEDTDYEIDYQLGMIKGLGAGITSGTTVKVTSTWLGVSGGWKVIANQDLTKEAQIRMIGEDQANDALVMVVIPRVQIKPMGDVSLIGEDFMEIQVGGKIMPDDNGESWYVEKLGTFATT